MPKILQPTPVLTPHPVTVTEEETGLPWSVAVLNDPVNLMEYVVLVFVSVLKMERSLATKHMLEVHHKGESVVWTGSREKAEHYVREILVWKLNAQLRAP